jgi:hypothetical protein
MTPAHEDAAASLAAIERTRRLATELRGYAHAGDIVLGWGLVWLVCNVASHFAPAWANQVWLAGILLGILWSIVRGQGGSGERPGWRVYASSAATVAFVALFIAVAGTQGHDQVNALISLFVAMSYVSMGIWTGLRFTWVGLAIAAIVVIGWFFDRGHLALWLGIGGGGGLIVTGLWLRRA